jgi:hypothetical protein
MAYGSSLISAVYFIDFHIAAIGVDFVWTCEAIAGVGAKPRRRTKRAAFATV